MNPSHVYDRAPLRVYWEVTRSCDLACRHCRAEAVPTADPHELDGAAGRALLDDLVRFGTPAPHVIFTGGDPLKRDDLFELIAYARSLGMGVSVAPSATPLLTPDVIHRLKAAGVEAISLSLDGATAAHHDAIRRVDGTYERTLAAAQAARDAGLAFQVNTLVSEETVDDLEALHQQVRAIGASRWSLFFLVTVGRGEVLRAISPERAESLLQWLATLGGRGLVVTTTEAPQLRRVLVQLKRARGADELTAPPAQHPGRPGHAAHGAGIRDGNGVMFISHTGELCPSGFLELSAGNATRDDVVAVYRHAQLFRDLRATSGFAGRCGRCDFRDACGGSRARAWSATGDVLGEDPLCTYQPA